MAGEVVTKLTDGWCVMQGEVEYWLCINPSGLRVAYNEHCLICGKDRHPSLLDNKKKFPFINEMIHFIPDKGCMIYNGAYTVW